jgi:signal transduction histidine kinase/CheY-like chemotaxis protein/HPt (histidine-containing phosphotransfer) domain-containing protein
MRIKAALIIIATVFIITVANLGAEIIMTRQVSGASLYTALLILAAGAISAYIASGSVVKPYEKIAEQNRHLEELTNKIREVHRRTKLMMDATPMCSMLWDRNGNIFDCNEESVKKFGLKSRQDFLERFFEFSPQFQPNGQLSSAEARMWISKTFEEGRCCFEWVHQLLDGTLFPCEMTLVRVSYDDGYIVAAYARDLQEHKKMMAETLRLQRELEAALEEAQEANRAKSDFLASMSHEMRTPMNAIICLSELMLSDDLVMGEVRENLDKIYNAGVTLLSIINDILDISKIESGKFEIIPVEYDLPSFINDTVTLNIMRIGEKPIQFKLNIDESLPSLLYGDDLRIKEICNNLLSNAFKYTNDGFVEWQVTFEQEENGEYGWLTCRVTDSGIGIKPENIPKLFTDYSQMDTRSNRRIEGTGLGLALTKRLTEIMGGSVTVESEYNKGSIFTARIRQKIVTNVPIGEEVANNLRAFRYFEGKRARNTKLQRVRLPYAKVLVVDDVPTNLDVARGMLKPYGMQVDCASGGQQAINIIRKETERYNAVFMDHMMPDMDGIEATRIIREEIGTDYARSVPIIALTANAIVGNEEMFLKKGFQAFLSKPIDIMLLDSVVRQWVRDKELEKLLADVRIEVDGQEIFDMRSGQERRILATRRSGGDRRKSDKSISGLYMSRGIERFGSEDTYFEVLGSFTKNTPALLNQLRDVTKQTLSGYAVTVHGIKGSSLSICADDLGACAEQLEYAAKAGDYAYISEHNDIFIAAAEKLIAEVSHKLQNQAEQNPKPLRPLPDQSVLANLLEACLMYDIDGLDKAMEELERYDYETQADLIGWLREKVSVMGFQQIAERLAQMV